MLRMPNCALLQPDSLEAALDAMASPGARLIAGGTDLLPAIKNGRESPPALVSLHRLAALRGVAIDQGARELRIGCSASLSELAADSRVQEYFPALAEAARSVASPQIRRRATIGGNVHIDTRCTYVSQPELWRTAIGGCLKVGGERCHVVDGGQRCVAALSSDCAPVLAALDARIVLASAQGRREVPLARYYRADGMRHVAREPSEIAVELRLPLPQGARRTAYVKWRPRASIDFPLVSVALRFDLDPRSQVVSASIVAGALGSRPRIVALPPEVVGSALRDPALATRAAGAVWEQCKPLANLRHDAEHRRDVARVLVRRTIERWQAEP